MDLTRITGFGDDPAARIMEIHSQLAGIERAMYAHLTAEARAERATEEAAMVARNAGGAGGLPGSRRGQSPFEPRRQSGTGAHGSNSGSREPGGQ